LKGYRENKTLPYTQVNIITVRFYVFMVVTMRMLSSGIGHPVALVRTDMSEERTAFIFTVKRLCVPPEPQGIIRSKKTAFFSATAMKT
jgi:hypothetical protein